MANMAGSRFENAFRLVLLFALFMKRGKKSSKIDAEDFMKLELTARSAACQALQAR